MSTELRELANSHLLFWSSYDSTIDAATQLFGPIDFFFRGADPEAHPLQPVQDAIEYILRGGFQNVEEPPEELPFETKVEGNETIPSTELVQEEREHQHHEAELIFSLFQDGDGSEKDPDGIPTRYLRMQQNNREAAAEALQDTLLWRKQHHVDTLLKSPHEIFDRCKEVFPHYFLGRDSEDNVVFLQRPALMNIELGHYNNITAEDLLMHYVYVNEYLWQVLEGSKPLGQMVSIIDLTGLHLGVLRKREYIDFLKLFVSTMDAHYPQRAHKTLVLNSPRWFNALYKLVSPMLRESTKAKIEIHSPSHNQDEAILHVLGDKAVSLVPKTFWSKKKKKELFGESGSEDEDEDSKDDSSEATGESGIHHPSDDYNPDSDMEREMRNFVSSFLKDYVDN